MEEADEPERQAEHQPGHHEHQAEQQEHVPPANVHAGGEDIGDVAPRLLIHVGEMDVALAALADEAAVAFAPGVNFAIAKAAHSGHVPEPQTVFFNGQEVVAVGSSHAHPSVGHSRVVFIQVPPALREVRR